MALDANDLDQGGAHLGELLIGQLKPEVLWSGEAQTSLTRPRVAPEDPPDGPHP